MSRSVFRMLYQLIEMVNKMCPALSFEESQVEFQAGQHCLTSHHGLFFCFFGGITSGFIL